MFLFILPANAVLWLVAVRSKCRNAQPIQTLYRRWCLNFNVTKFSNVVSSLESKFNSVCTMNATLTTLLQHWNRDVKFMTSSQRWYYDFKFSTFNIALTLDSTVTSQYIMHVVMVTSIQCSNHDFNVTTSSRRW